MKIAIPRCMPRCKICHRPLADPASIAQGFGPECAVKFAWMLCDAGLTLEALEIPVEVSTDSNVARWLRLAECALLAGEKDRVERFKAAAKYAARRLIPMLPAALKSTGGRARSLPPKRKANCARR